MSALALTLTHNFRRQSKDIAVLRFDGVNNLGESDKDAGLQQDGKNTLHYTISDGIDDLLGAIEWAHNNPYVDATDIILVSVSFSSVAVRSALTYPEASSVGRWIVYMGAADAQNSIMNVSGNFDAWGNYVRGIANGTVTLQGCMVDGDRFCRDLDERRAATLEDARRDLASIDVPITWLIGKHDAWMDPRRIHDIMSVKAPNEREIVEVDTGHTPTSSDEALAQFQLIARLCWSHLYGENVDAVVPPRGWLAAVAEQEWSRVRSTDGIHNEQYWESYLLSDDKLGYDLLRYVPAYREFAAIQALEARPAGAEVLELGSGTGIVADPILQEGPTKLTCVDIVEPVLNRLEQRLGDHLEVGVVKADADGNPRTAVRRWLNGEFRSVLDLAGRIPAANQPFLESVAGCTSDSVHALLRGAPLDIRKVRSEARLPESMEPLLYDLNLMAKVELGLVSPEEAAASVRRVPPSVFAGRPGLPFPSKSYDAIIASLLLSYLEYPSDCLSECFRILRPGGRLVVSTMKPDADTSVIYREFLETLETSSAHELPYEKQDMLAAARGLLNKAAEVIRHEQEGFFCFYTEEQLTALVRKAGFGHVRVRYAYGSPAQAIIVSCRKPRMLD
jgi:ubiquinone/menaquinone biosynthesis C-methylase UbiE/pimeloyl-ACP methyl ester carboxylesterase